MTCLRMPRTCVLLDARAVMRFGVVAHDAMPCRGDSRWKATCLQSTSVPPARPHSTPTAQRATVLCANSNRKKTAFTITDREVMTTWILTPNQSATLAAHPWRIQMTCLSASIVFPASTSLHGKCAERRERGPAVLFTEEDDRSSIVSLHFLRWRARRLMLHKAFCASAAAGAFCSLALPSCLVLLR